jgi:wobble nucleotide-excising tRNase
LERSKLLRELIAGKDVEQKNIVTQKDGRFYLRLPEGELDAHLVAEGYRKMATLLYLLRNGSLTKDSILFWDEPEANLNPKLVVKMVELLHALAALGMQIFVTTHDYLFSHELSLLAEYPSQTSVKMKFFALHKPDRLKGVYVEAGETLASIEHNAILDEFAAHYDRQVGLFNAEGIDE